MDIEKLIGIEVETVGGEVLGEVIGIELYGPKITLVVSGDFVFVDEDPDGDDGEPVPVPEKNDFDDFVGNEPQMNSNILKFVKRV